MAPDKRVNKTPPGGHLQAAVTTTSNILWTIYRTYFSGVVGHVVPAHTREAAFQLFCDLRANTPKDQKFVTRHMRAFVPHTGTGWLAMCSTLAYALAGLLGLACVTLTLSVMGIYTGLAVAVVGGVVLSLVLSALAITMFITACCSGMFAAGALLSYASLSTTMAVFRFFLGMVVGPPPTARAELPTTAESPAPGNLQLPSSQASPSVTWRLPDVGSGKAAEVVPAAEPTGHDKHDSSTAVLPVESTASGVSQDGKDSAHTDGRNGVSDSHQDSSAGLSCMELDAAALLASSKPTAQATRMGGMKLQGTQAPSPEGGVYIKAVSIAPSSV